MGHAALQAGLELPAQHTLASSSGQSFLASLTMVVITGQVHMSGLNLMLFISARPLQPGLSTAAAALDFTHPSGCPAQCDLVLTWEETESGRERARGPKATFSR